MAKTIDSDENDLAALTRLIRRANDRVPQVVLEAGEVTGSFELLPAERIEAQHFTPRRSDQFAAGCFFARKALERHGYTDFPLLRDADGAPIWPKGISGSIAHKYSLCVSASAPSSKYASIGIDLEKDEVRDEAAIASTIALPGEVEQLRHCETLGLRSPSTGLLSAKEAAYKAAFPQLRRPIEWLEIDVRTSGRDSFEARIGGCPEWSGKGLLLTDGCWILALSWPESDKSHGKP